MDAIEQTFNRVGQVGAFLARADGPASLSGQRNQGTEQYKPAHDLHACVMACKIPSIMS